MGHQEMMWPHLPCPNPGGLAGGLLLASPPGDGQSAFPAQKHRLGPPVLGRPGSVGRGGRLCGRPCSHLRLSVCPQAPPPPKRAPTTALTLRSKSMTSELEELGKSRPSGLPCRQHVASMKPSPCMALCLPACPPPRPSLGIAPGAPLAASSSRWHPCWNPVAPGCGY